MYSGLQELIYYIAPLFVFCSLKKKFLWLKEVTMSNLRKLHAAYVIWLDIDVSWPVEGSLRPDPAEQGF